SFTAYAGAPDRSADSLRLYLRQSKSAQAEFDRDHSPDFDPSRFHAMAMPNTCSWGERSPEFSNGPYSASSFTSAVQDFPFSRGSRPFESPERRVMGRSESRGGFEDQRPSFATPLNDMSLNNYYFDSPSSSEGKTHLWL